MSDEPRYCILCAHSVGVISAGLVDPFFCRQSNTTRVGRVSGMTLLLRCSDLRENDDSCGPEGKFFERAKP